VNWLAAASAAAAVSLVAAVSHAGPELERARAALDDLRYEDAAEALDEALRAGDNGPADVQEIYRMRAEVAAALGDRGEAVAYFDRLLALDPNAAMREGASPKITEPFETARSRAGARKPLGFRCEVGDGAVEVRVEADPLSMAAGAFEQGGGDYETAELEGREAVIVVADAVLAEEVGLLDEHGNRLTAKAVAECGQEMVSPARGRHTKSARPRDDGGSILGHWALWGGVAVGFAAAGTYFGLQARSDIDDLEALVADSSSHEFSEAQALEDHARRNALFANIGFAAAGATAIVSAVLLVRGAKDSGEGARKTVVVSPTAAPGSVGVTFAMPF